MKTTEESPWDDLVKTKEEAAQLKVGDTVSVLEQRWQEVHGTSDREVQRLIITDCGIGWLESVVLLNKYPNHEMVVKVPYVRRLRRAWLMGKKWRKL